MRKFDSEKERVRAGERGKAREMGRNSGRERSFISFSFFQQPRG